jgi:hypothetical protein
VKMCEDFARKFGENGTGCCITATHRHRRSERYAPFYPRENMPLLCSLVKGLFAPQHLFWSWTYRWVWNPDSPVAQPVA